MPFSNDHEILIGLHSHDEIVAGLEVACSCGDVLFIEEDPDGLLSLSEVNAVAQAHRSV